MTIHRLPAAVYHCNVPNIAEKAVFGSTTNGGGKPSHSPPFPAWPDIEDRGHWCCLPGLKRAMFIGPQGIGDPSFYELEFEYIEKYSEMLNPQVGIEATLLAIVSVLGISENEEELNLKHPSSANKLFEYAATWAISQTFERGAKDAYSLVHEFGHIYFYAMKVYSALYQNDQSTLVHHFIETISTIPQLSPRDLQHLWKQFFAANDQFVLLVQKFEVIEEIVATLFGIWALAPEVKLEVLDELWLVLKKSGYFRHFCNFTIGCGKNLDRALSLMELCTILLDWSYGSLDEVIPLSIGILDSMIGPDASAEINDIDDWLNSNYPGLEPFIDAINASRQTPVWPKIILISPDYLEHGFGE